jgi:hypothetical protein
MVMQNDMRNVTLQNGDPVDCSMLGCAQQHYSLGKLGFNIGITDSNMGRNKHFMSKS